MNCEIGTLIQDGEFKEFDYRVLYFRPTHYSEERIAVGLLANANGRVEAKFVSTPSAIDLMARIFGEAGVEHFQFAVSEIRRQAARTNDVGQFEIPTDLLVAGETSVAFTNDRSGFLSSVLTSCSTLLRYGECRMAERLSYADAVLFSQEVIDHVSRLHPFLGNSIFHHQVNMSSGEVVDLPILGNRVFGAPVSFALRDHRMRAEAYVAKFNWVRNQVTQEPRMYVLAPSRVVAETSERLERSIRELCAVAQAHQVPVKLCESTAALAAEIVQDEAA